MDLSMYNTSIRYLGQLAGPLSNGAMNAAPHSPSLIASSTFVLLECRPRFRQSSRTSRNEIPHIRCAIRRVARGIDRSGRSFLWVLLEGGITWLAFKVLAE